MIFDANAAVEKLVDSEHLDQLLEAARAQTAKLAGHSPETAATTEELHKRAAAAQSDAAFAAQGIREMLQAKEAEREQKVAIVMHMLSVGSRLLA